MKKGNQKQNKKDFDSWNNLKKLTDKEQNRYYTVREIWWCRFGVNVGNEQDGKGTYFLRPVLIVRSFGSKTCLIVPLTTSKQIHPMRVPIGDSSGKQSSVVLSQMKVIDTKRLVEKICFLDKKTFSITINAIKQLFDSTY